METEIANKKHIHTKEEEEEEEEEEEDYFCCSLQIHKILRKI
jgi:hypothetical protein